MRVCDELRLVHITNPKTGGTSIRQAMAKAGSMRSTYRVTAAMPSYFTVMFVRNPFDRLVSCYADKYNWGQNPNWIRTKYLMLAKIYGLAQDNSFEQFARKIGRIPDRLSDRHFKSQHWIYRQNLRRSGKIDFIGRFESFAEDIEALRQRVPLAPVGHINRSQHDDWRTYYTEDLADFVYERYQVDFDTWYPEAYGDLISYLRNTTPPS